MKNTKIIRLSVIMLSGLLCTSPLVASNSSSSASSASSSSSSSASAPSFNRANWPVSGGDILNTRNAKKEKRISKRNAHKLQEKWIFKMAESLSDEELEACSDNLLASNFLNISVSNSPAVVGNKLYFTDWCGFITALNKNTGKLIWRKNFIKDLSVPGYYMNFSRNTPAVKGNQLIVGNTFYLNSPLCIVNEAANKPPFNGHPFTDKPLPTTPTGAIYDRTGGAIFTCHKGDGATVISLNRHTGEVLWRKKVHSHPAAKVTGSINIRGNIAYVPVGSWEEEWSRLYPNIYKLGNNSDYPNNPELLDSDDIDLGKPYPCCSFRGKVVAIDIQKKGKILWEHNTSIGLDPDNEIQNPSVREALLAGDGKGFFGVSTYGNTMPIDVKNKQLYYATAETYNAPPVLTECEKVRRATGKVNPDNNDVNLPAGINSCNELNDAMKTYGNAIVALDLKTGKVNWSFFARQYDPWTHACDQPDFALGTWVVPVVLPDPVSNVSNNCEELIGPDYGFGHQPVVIRDVKFGKKKKDLVIAGNKDGRLFALNAKTGKPIWRIFDPEAQRVTGWRKIDPGAIYGGLQFGIATDGKAIYTGTANNHNMARDPSIKFDPVENFIKAHFDDNPFYTDLYPLVYPSGFTVQDPPQMGNSLHHRFDGDAGQKRAGAGPRFPYFSIGIGVAAFGSPTSGLGLPTMHPFFPDGVNWDGTYEPYVTGPVSGPKELWRLVNPPKDIIVDCVNVFNVNVDIGNPETQTGPTQDLSQCTPGPFNGTDPIYTIAGMITAVDVKTGDILWQRPATDGVVGRPDSSTMVQGSVSVANGVVFAGISDGKGTMVGLNAKNGKLLFLFQASEDKPDGSTRISGGFDASPSIVNGVVYWGVGTGTASAFLSEKPTIDFILELLSQDPLTNYSGNRVYAFELPFKKKRDKKGRDDSSDDS